MTHYMPHEKLQIPCDIDPEKSFVTRLYGHPVLATLLAGSQERALRWIEDNCPGDCTASCKIRLFTEMDPDEIARILNSQNSQGQDTLPPGEEMNS